ncbi:MAG TPA: ETC complex I subunit [Rhizomicrobium sp.]|nr:ETC complex I subunit [Rhizomicrobium sp.]
MRARIYQPARNAMQSGKARSAQWLLEFEPESARGIDPLMGWTSSRDMRQQVQLEFDGRDEAVAYATRHGIDHQVFEPHKPAPKAKSYSDNFRVDRKEPWSH